MGTSGVIGFLLKGRYYVNLNSFDSQPGLTGFKLVLEILNADLTKWQQLLGNIVLVNNEMQPTQEQIKFLKKYTNPLPFSSFQTELEWEDLLYFTSNSFHHTLHAGYLQNYVDAANQPCEEEYSYILNFDNKTFDYNRHGSRYDEKDEQLRVPLVDSDLYACAQNMSGDKDLSRKYDPEENLASRRKWREDLGKCYGYRFP